MKKRTFQNAYGSAAILVVFDDEQDKFLHIVRHVVAANGRRFENVNRVIMGNDIPDDVVDEAVGVVVSEVIKASQ